VAAAVVGLLLAGCGDDEKPPAGAPAAAPRTSAGEFTSTDGYRYRIVLVVGDESDCQPAGGSGVPVALTVTNLAGDRPAPFPPLRVELIRAAGVKPEQVPVRDPSGTCTFTPRVPSLAPGQSVTFAGATPRVESAGRVEVAISESTFTVAAQVP
jgi:hypothetical protein